MKNLIILVNSQSFYGSSGQLYDAAHRLLDAYCVE